jgi:hypothetical protein
MSKKYTPPAVGDLFADKAYMHRGESGRTVRVVDVTKGWDGKPNYVIEVTHHIFPDVIGRRTSISAGGLRTRYIKENAA